MCKYLDIFRHSYKLQPVRVLEYPLQTTLDRAVYSAICICVYSSRTVGMTDTDDSSCIQISESLYVYI